MKKIITCIIFIIFFLIGVSQAAEVNGSLFTPYEGPLQLDPQSVNPAVVLRQRLVSLRLELLPRAEGQEVILNLFDDVAVRAICDGLETNVSGGFVWNGHTQDQAKGLVTFTIADQALAGTVEIPNIIYHIRPFRDQVHVIREIRPAVRRTAFLLADAAPSSVEHEVVGLVNLEREIVNLHPLVWDDALGAASRGHSADMAQQNYFSHTSLDGREFNQRITAAGYAYKTCGENIAAGYSTTQAVMNGWMNSPGHRANILSSTFCDIGVGYAFGSASTYRHYWTQDFGRRQGVSVCTMALWPGALCGGWCETWMGWVNDVYFPWGFHDIYGWIYIFGTDRSNLWFFNLRNNDYWWTTADLWPYIYFYNEAGWFYNEPGTNWFVNLKTGQWVQK